jgi:hypothetical protein
LAYQESSTFPAEESDPVFSFLVKGGANVLFSEIFNGVPQLYPGSSFEVEEVFEATIEILRPELIDTDFKWFPPKRYFGSWTISDTLPGFGVSSEDRGFIESEVFKIKRYSTFVIQANADVPIAAYEESAIDNCNFFQINATVPTPPIPVGAGVLGINNSVFKSRETLRKVPLIDRVFLPKLRFVGLYVSLGSVLTSASYKARIINGISVNLPPFGFDVCTLVPAQNCEQLFNAELINQQGFATQAEAIAYNVANCPIPPNQSSSVVPVPWTCPLNPADIRTIYLPECLGF